MKLSLALQEATTQLQRVEDHPLLAASILLAFVLKQPRSYLHAYPETELTPQQSQLFFEVVRRRCQQEPMAYLTGTQAFWSLTLQVTPATLIPRPETELLVETLLNLSDNKTVLTLADLGTGSGAIALAVASERPAWQIYATDVSESALAIASKNAQQLALHQVSFCQGHWCTALPPKIGFDAIVSNPPYIAETEWAEYAEGLRFEPTLALVSGSDGLNALREISHTAPDYLKSGGYLLVEHGYWQGPMVRQLFAEAGYQAVHSILDLQGQERVTVGRKR